MGSKYLRQDDLLTYIKLKRGIAKSVAKSIIKDYSDFIVCSLCEQDRVHIPGLGSFVTIPSSRYGMRIKFRPTHKFKRIIKGLEDPEDHYSPVTKLIWRESHDNEKDIPISPTAEELGRDKEGGENIIRRSFINYLKEDLPYGKDWKHPLSENLVSQQLIKEKLEFYRQDNPEGYYLLWSLWTSQNTREGVAIKHNYSSSSVQRRWNEAINTLLTLILFPELEPKVPIELQNEGDN